MKQSYQKLAFGIGISLLLLFVQSSLSKKGPWVSYGLTGMAFVVFLMWRGQVTHFVRSAFAAVFYTGLLWYWHSQTPMPTEVAGFFNLPALRFKLFDSGPIPLAILSTFLSGLHYLVLVWKSKFIPLNMSNIADQDVIKAVREQDDRALLQALSTQGTSGYYGQRLYRLRVRLSRDQDLAAVIALKDDILEIDEEDYALAFTAVTWCEAALPLWGFLGTVVGIGEAVVAVAQGVRTLLGTTPVEGLQMADLMARVLEDLNRGFQGMGVAFDTTFLGLAGVIIVSVGHMALKKALAARLAQARSLFSDAVAQWKAESAVVVALTDLEGRLQAVEAAVRATDLRATQFRETVHRMVERVLIEDPAYHSIKRVLFKPVVVFQRVGGDLADQTAQHITAHLGHDQWEFVALGVPVATNSRSVVHGGVVALEDKKTNQNWLLHVDMAGPYNQDLFQTARRFTTLWPLQDLATGVGQTQTSELVSVRMTQPPQAQERVFPLRITPDERVFPVVVDHQALALILRRVPQAQHFGVSWVGNDGKDPQDAGRLPTHSTWSVWAAHAPSATLVAAGKSVTGNRWRLLLAPLRQRPVEQERGQPQQQPTGFDFASLDQWVELPAGLVPQQAVPLANDLILLLDTSGKLHYWDTTRPVPLQLSHAAWVEDPQGTIYPGAGGWIAVVAQDHLRMWRVRRGGLLYPYDEQVSFPITLVNRHSFRVTADGQYLFATAEQTITTWEFPRYAGALDDL